MRTTETARLRPRNISHSPSALRWRSLAFDTSLRDYSGRTDGNYLNKKQKAKNKKEKRKTQNPEREWERSTDRCRRRANPKPKASRRRGEAEGEPVGVAVPIEPAAAAERKVDQKDSRSEATLSFPLFAPLRRGPSEGGLALWGRLLLLTFLGETRKVSGCRAAPGAFFRPENDKN